MALPPSSQSANVTTFSSHRPVLFCPDNATARRWVWPGWPVSRATGVGVSNMDLISTCPRLLDIELDIDPDWLAHLRSKLESRGAGVRYIVRTPLPAPTSCGQPPCRKVFR